MLQLARSCDREGINRLSRQVHAMHVSWRPDLFQMADELYPPERMTQCIQCRQLYVARLADQVAGFVLIKIREYDSPGHVRRKVLLLDEICVEEALRCRGLGSAMMEDVKALGRAFGCTDLQLGVYPQNEQAVAFYQKHGLMIRSIDMQMKL